MIRPVVILEGAAGTGKTTVATILAEILGCPVYRPFRGQDNNNHLPGADGRLKELGFKTNTWVEDLYTADVLSAVIPRVVLDRSMPSGLAYDGKLDLSQRGSAMALWSERLSAIATLFLLQMPEGARRVRSGQRFYDWEAQAILDECCKAGMFGVKLISVDAMCTPQEIAWDIFVCVAFSRFGTSLRDMQVNPA